MTTCPICGAQFKDPGRVRGGMLSRRTLTPKQQAELQAARARHRAANQGGPPTCSKCGKPAQSFHSGLGPRCTQHTPKPKTRKATS